MSRSYFTTQRIPRNFFPSKINSTIPLKDGTELTVGSDNKDISRSFYLTDGKASVWLYFDKGYLSMYDINNTFAWNGTGEPLLKIIRSLTRGKFPKKTSEKKRACPVPKSRHKDTKVARKTEANSRSPKQRKLAKD
jgi:hypothetical protein